MNELEIGKWALKHLEDELNDKHIHFRRSHVMIMT